MNGQAIHVLARQLVHEGYLDNEPDALIAAIEIMLAAQDLQEVTACPSPSVESLPHQTPVASSDSVGSLPADVFFLADSRLV